ncbi:unnamed protein product [Schistosoma turkestanicum]|nr:unnamed protein product [Schistosoma turkestanicum]
MPISGFSDFDELSSCETLLYHNGLPGLVKYFVNSVKAISFTHVFDKKKVDSCSQSLRISDVASSKTYSSIINDSEKSVVSNSKSVVSPSKTSNFHSNQKNQLTLADSFLLPDSHSVAAVRKHRGRRRHGKANVLNCSSVSPFQSDQSGLLETSSIEKSFSPLRLSESGLAEPVVEKGLVNGDASTVSGCSVLTVGESKAVCVLTAIDSKVTDVDKEGGAAVEPVGAVVPVMVGRRRGRRGTVRGNVGSGESFSPLRLSESGLAEPVVEKGLVNGDASTVSGCSVLTVGESKAVCVLTAIDSKVTDVDKEEISMSMNDDLNSPVVSRSISSPDRGGAAVEPVGAVVPVMVGRRRGRRGTVRGNVGSGESFSPLRLSESGLAEPVVEKGLVNGDASTVSGCSVLTVGESKAVCVLTAIDSKVTDVDKEEISMSMNDDLNSPVVSRSISSPDRGGAAVEPVGAVVPVMVGRRRGRRGTVRGNVGSGVNELEGDSTPESYQISNGTRLSRPTCSRGSSDSKLHPETVNTILPLIKPITTCVTECLLDSEDDDDAVDSKHLVKKFRENSVVLEEMKSVPSDENNSLARSVSSRLALSPIPYRYEDDVTMPEALTTFNQLAENHENSSRSLSNYPIIPKGRPSVTFAPNVVYFDSRDNSQPRVSVGPIACEESDMTHFNSEMSTKPTSYEDSLTQSENKENIESFTESTAYSSIQASNDLSPSTSSLSLPKIELPWRTPYDCQFFPFKSQRPLSKSFIQSGGQLRRSKRLRAPATHDRNKVVVYEPDKDEYGLVYQKPVGLAILPDPDEITRRQRFLNRLKRCQNNRTQFLKIEKIKRTKRLQKLAKRYGSLKGTQKSQTDSCVRIHLDSDVQWISPTETRLPIGINDASPFQQVIFPENAQFSPFKFSTMECSSYIVPALSGVCPSRTKTRLPCFEVDANLTMIVSEEQERRQLHYDPNAINVFKIMSSPPSVLINNNRDPYIPYAVQIAKFAIPLTKPCIVYIPKGIPYKFMNATKENLNICRIRYVLT